MATTRRRVLVSTTTFPMGLSRLFEELTGHQSDKWALSAAIAIARFRKRRRMSPTFSEMFTEVLETPGLRELSRAIDWTDLTGALTYSFRHHVAVHWRRLGWISWNSGTRSLRVGPTFARASQRHQESRQG
jgi:hypothetical protein